MNYGTNFVIFEMFHQHVIFFIKCHFLGSGELCVNHTHNCLNWLFEYCFRCHSIYLRERFFSSSSHQNEGMKSKESRESQAHTLELSNTQPAISRLVILLQSQSLHWNCLWNSIEIWKQMLYHAFCGNNIAIVCWILWEMHFVVIIMVKYHM